MANQQEKSSVIIESNSKLIFTTKYLLIFKLSLSKQKGQSSPTHIFLNETSTTALSHANVSV